MELTMTSTPGTAREGFSRRTGYAAAGVAFAYAAVSLYWAMGGTAGLETLGDRLEQLAQERDPTLIGLTWVAVVLKSSCGVLALGLVQRWGTLLPRRLLLTASWAGAAVLVLYGGLQIIMGSLAEFGIVHLAPPVDWAGLRWHLGLWDMWFLVMGLLLGAAAWHYTRKDAARGTRVLTPRADRGIEQ